MQKIEFFSLVECAMLKILLASAFEALKPNKSLLSCNDNLDTAASTYTLICYRTTL